MNFRCIRSCFIGGQIYLKDDVWNLPESFMESTKFQALGQPPVEEPDTDAPETQREPKPGEFVCPECERVCKSSFGLQSHMRVHQPK